MILKICNIPTLIGYKLLSAYHGDDSVEDGANVCKLFIYDIGAYC